MALCLVGQNHLCTFVFKFGPVMQMLFIDISHPVADEMSFKYISYLELWQPLCSAEQSHLWTFGKVHHEEQFCEII